MSTEHQQYSIENQSAAIALYAAAHGMGIVRSYVDAGKSGVTIKGRNALQELISIVDNGKADFSLILVYDVSRWGRFRDADEAAHYEFICKRAGIQVRYCAEQFENDNSPTSNLLKALKRMMAGEYSRELSTKVFAGQCRLASLGFRQGGRRPYGMQRQMIDQNGAAKQLLKQGEYKATQMDRVILVPGPKDEVENVRRVFDLYTKSKQYREQIVATMNGQTDRLYLGRAWTRGVVTYILENPVYIGSNTYARHDFKKPRGRSKLSPKEQWIVRENAFQPIISAKQFAQAQARLAEERRRVTNEEMLAALRRLWLREGTLSMKLIDRARDIPSTTSFYNRFGGMTQAYELVGFIPKRSYSQVPANHIRQLRIKIWKEIAVRVAALGGTVEPLSNRRELMLINGTVTARIMFSRPRTWRTGHTLWPLPLKHKNNVDIAIIARLDPAYIDIIDYYVFPQVARVRGRFYIRRKDNAAFIDLYRYDNLGAFVSCLGLSSIREAM